MRDKGFDSFCMFDRDAIKVFLDEVEGASELGR